MLTATAAVLAGLILLILSADRFVLGAAALAKAMNISTLVIGMVVIGFGTSAPELVVSINAALSGNGGLAVGNALGSNIANLGLILGVAALFVPLLIQSTTLRREYPILLITSLIAYALLRDHQLSQTDAMILLALLAVALASLILLALKADKDDALTGEFSEEIPEQMPIWKALAWLIGGMAVLIGAAKLLVWGAVSIATAYGVSDLVIGLTIVAIGTSLPELAAAIAAALKREPDLIIGNVIGSNLFNTLAVLAIPGLFGRLNLDDELATRDFPTVLALTLALPLLALAWRRPARLGRIGAAVLLVAFIGYQYSIYLSIR